MFIGPKKLKFKKYHKQKLNYLRCEKSGFVNKFGLIGIQACENKRLTTYQLEAVRRAIRRGLRDKEMKIKINVFPFFGRTKKPVSSRMGKGKGKHSHWEANVHSGKVLFELCNLDPDESNIVRERVLNMAIKKLSLQSRIIRLKF